MATRSYTKMFISEATGLWVDWYTVVSELSLTGQSLAVTGNDGADTVYVGNGTNIDATGLGASAAVDKVYLQGHFADYNITHDADGNYTITGARNGRTEVVKITSGFGENDLLYFADGHVNTGNANLFDDQTGAFKDITVGMVSGDGTPGLSDIQSIAINADDSTTTDGGLYTVGQDIVFDVVFKDGKAVDVDVAGGQPRLKVQLDNGQIAYANFDATLSGGTRNLSVAKFVYTVQPGQMDSDGVSVASKSLELQGGSITLTGTTNDAKLDNHPVMAKQAGYKVDTAGLHLTSEALKNGELTALDVDGQLVLEAKANANSPSDLKAVVGKKIRLVHTTDATRTQEIDVTDTRFVTISDNQVIIKPPFDFDFGGAYRVEVDADAFTATVNNVENTQSRAMVAADDLGFGTVNIDAADSVANAAQGQVVKDDGTVESGKQWINGSGQGDWLAGDQVDLDLAVGDYAVVIKDGGRSGARTDQGDGVEIKDGFNLGLSNVGSGDRLYVDDTANDKTQLNDRRFSQITENSAGGLDIFFNPAGDGDGKGSTVHIKSVEGNSSLNLYDTEAIRDLLNVSNTRLGTTITGIERVDTDASKDFGGDLAPSTTFDVKVSANFRSGDKVQLVRLDADDNEVNWGSEVEANTTDIAAGHITLSQSSLSDLMQGRNKIYAKVTGADGAVTKGPLLFDAQGGFDYDTTPPAPKLAEAESEDDLTPEVSEDKTLSDTETSVMVEITEGWSVGDKYQLKLGDVNLGDEVEITEGMLDNGRLWVSIEKGNFGASTQASLGISLTDRAGNVGAWNATLDLVILA
jgi:hypothetical protein